jgi:homoserine O-acetyltransferase
MVERKVFEKEGFVLENGKSIKLVMGYETYGMLNAAKDNAILVAHGFSGNGHAAGKFSDADPAPGYWDALIGPGKAVDTDKYFVVSPDALCNTNKMPFIKTCGPSSINPATGKPYGLSFPVVTCLDMAMGMKTLCESLGIKKLKAVMGASMGGFISIQLAVHAPDYAEKMIGVVTAPANPITPSFHEFQWAMAKSDPKWNGGDYYGKADPIDAATILQAFVFTLALTPAALEGMFPRGPADEDCYTDIMNKSGFDKALLAMAAPLAATQDVNSWLYSSRATMTHNIARGFKDESDALSRIKADTLLISNKQDIFEPAAYAERMYKEMQALGKPCEFYLFDDVMGHMAFGSRVDLYEDKVREFLNK